jgi:hypothetical protein
MHDQGNCKIFIKPRLIEIETRIYIARLQSIVRARGICDLSKAINFAIELLCLVSNCAHLRANVESEDFTILFAVE